MGYAIMRMQKLKTNKDMSDSYNHNMRIFDVENADPLLAHMNKDYYDQLNGRSYIDIYEDTVRERKINGSQRRAIRKDAVKGLEVMLTYSRDSGDISVDEWARANVEWLKSTFNPPGGKATYTHPGTGEEVTEEIDNVKSVMLHLDESTPHIHAFVVPVDNEGKLNAKFFLPDRKALVELQSDYADAMESFGLKRGVMHSVSKHEAQSSYYNKLLEAVEAELPEPLPGENVFDYRVRANDVYRTMKVHHRDEIIKRNRDVNEAKAEVRGLKGLSREFEGEELTLERYREIKAAAEDYKKLQKAIEESPNRDDAESAAALNQRLIHWQEQRERDSRRRGKTRTAENEKNNER